MKSAKEIVGLHVPGNKKGNNYWQSKEKSGDDIENILENICREYIVRGN